VNIEAGGGPSPSLRKEDMLPRHVRLELRLGTYGQACVADLFRKYKVCMRRMGAEGGEEEGSSDGGGSSSSRDSPAAPNCPSRMSSAEEMTASFRHEAQLLRRACTNEMRQVAVALSEDSQAVPRRQWAEREFLRAAAWGDKETLEELMPSMAREAGADAALLGWTAWHAAAAHGQACSVAVLQGGARRDHPAQGLEKPTACGMVPLCVACLQGHAEAVRALLLAEASVDVRDSRGNSPLLWASAATKVESAKAIVQALLRARADPSVCNRSGQQVDLPSLLPTAPSASSGSGIGHGGRERSNSDAAEQEEHEPYYCVRATGACQAEEQGFFAKTVSRLKPPIRDSLGFLRKADAKVLSLLGQDEVELGVWSTWATNYTHAGLTTLLEDCHPDNGPTHPSRSRQALVLTSERVLLLDGASWGLMEMIDLTDIHKLITPSCSETVLLLRLRRRPDVLLDVAERKRFLHEVQLAISEARWPGGGREIQDPSRVVLTANELAIPLLDSSGSRAGTLAFVELDVFLLLPHAPHSLLLSGVPTITFGFLDLQRRLQPRAAGAGVVWRWQRYFFVLKDGRGSDRCLLWCHHPNAAHAVDSVPISNISQVKFIDASHGDYCLIIERSAQGSGGSILPALTLRARSVKDRQDWANAIRSLQASAR